MKRFMTALAAALLATAAAFPSVATAQQASELGPAVRPFVSVSEPVVALTGARLVDGTGAPAVGGRTIVIEDGRIAAVGPDGRVDIPAEARVLDLSGKTVLPGFVMLHEHLFYPAGGGAYNQQESSFPPLYLAGGATTIRTGGSRDPYGDLSLKADIDAGRVAGPRMHVTGPYLNGPGLPIRFVNRLEDPAAARRLVEYWSAEGATSFKAYMHITRAALAEAIEAAHARGHHVTGHLCSVTYREAADLGIDNLEHGFLAATDFVADKEPDRCPSGDRRDRSLLELDVNGPEAGALIDHLVERGVAVTSTLTIFEPSVPGRYRAPRGAIRAMSPDARERYLTTWSSIATSPDSDWPRLLQQAMALEKRFADAGGRLVVGTDPTGYGGVVAGYGNLRAIEILVEMGFAFPRAINIATLEGAALMGEEERVGSVEPGKLADLVVVNGDPVSDVADIWNVELVFKDGVGYDARALFESVEGTVGIR